MKHSCNIFKHWHRYVHYTRHNERDDVSNHRRLDCLHNLLFRRGPKKTSKLRVTGLCEGKSPVTGEFPAQRASNAENVSIWWRHHGPSIWTCSWWCHHMETITVSLHEESREGNPMFAGGFPSQWASNTDIWCFSFVGVNKALNKHSIFINRLLIYRMLWNTFEYLYFLLISHHIVSQLWTERSICFHWIFFLLFSDKAMEDMRNNMGKSMLWLVEMFRDITWTK